jgi:1-acyl-sn-glycerol-3-phosphate acyltransferase
MSGKIPTRYYSSFDEDFSKSKNQDYVLPQNYKWLRTSLPFRFASAALYSLALLISSVYCRLFLHIRFKNRKILKETLKTGAFIYANHTQPIGDVFTPALACFPNRIYTLVSPANLGIPVIGRILPHLGALPIPHGIHKLKELRQAVEYRANQNKCIVIYPEAHVWEYCTMIRPFSETSFTFPVKYRKPVYCMTTTYQKRKFGKKPSATVYIDGPFEASPGLSAKEQSKELHDTVERCMKERSRESNCSYIKYEAVAPK